MEDETEKYPKAEKKTSRSALTPCRGDDMESPGAEKSPSREVITEVDMSVPMEGTRWYPTAEKKTSREDKFEAYICVSGKGIDQPKLFSSVLSPCVGDEVETPSWYPVADESTSREGHWEADTCVPMEKTAWHPVAKEITSREVRSLQVCGISKPQGVSRVLTPCAGDEMAKPSCRGGDLEADADTCVPMENIAWYPVADESISSGVSSEGHELTKPSWYTVVEQSISRQDKLEAHTCVSSKSVMTPKPFSCASLPGTRDDMEKTSWCHTDEKSTSREDELEATATTGQHSAVDEVDVFAYRPDIDGLRAVAVAAVTLFHVNESWLPGGFVGVDMFFVISGYVVAASLLRHKSQTIVAYFIRFFSRRTKRLTPSLVLVTFLTGFFKELLVPPWILFSTESYVAGQWALIGCSNNYFSLLDDAEGGYFEESADIQDNYFMHTWSLGVEEQFYLVFPFILLLVHRSRVAKTFSNEPSPHFSVLVLGLASLGSMLFSGMATRNGSKFSFYNVGSRFWEMASGAILFHLQYFNMVGLTSLSNKAVAIFVLQVAAVTSIALAFIYTDSDSNFPMPWSVLPVFGTLCFMIAGSGRHAVLNQYLSWRLPVYVGKLSYPIYLWHWPLLVIFDQARGIVTHRGPREFSYTWQYFAYLALLAIGSVATYHLVEGPFRSWHPKKDRNVFALLFPAIGLSMLWLSLLRGPMHGEFYVTPYQDGPPGISNFNNTACACEASVPTRWVSDNAQTGATSSGLPYCFVEKQPSTDHACKFQKEHVDPCWLLKTPIHKCLRVDRGDHGKQRALFLIGDSKACHLQHVMRYTLRGIMPVLWKKLKPHQYRDITPFIQAGDVVVVSTAAFKYTLTEKYSHLYEMGLRSYEIYLEALHQLTSEVGVTLVLMGDTPLLRRNAINCIPTLFSVPESCDVTLAETQEFLRPLHSMYSRLAKTPGILFFDFHHLLCNDQVCGSLIPGTKTHAFVDDSHFSIGGSMYLWPFICSFFKENGLLEPTSSFNDE